MQRTSALAVCLIGAATFASAQQSARPDLQGPTPLREHRFGAPTSVERPTFIPGEVVIRYAQGQGRLSAEAQSIETEAGLLSIEHNATLGFHRYQLPTSTTVAETLRKFRGDSRIDFIEPNYLYYLHDVPTDSFYDNYAGVASDLQKWAMDANNVNAEAAWDVTTGRSDVIIAVVDSGCQRTHPDLAANMWTNSGEIAGNGVDDDGNGFIDDVHGWDWYFNDNDPNPDYGDGFDNDFNGAADDGSFHGTFAASNAAAVANNGTGMAGAAWNCQIMALKVFTDDGGASTVDIANACTYAANNGAKVINMSLGGGYSSVLESAVNYAHSQGLITVASAGNGNSSSQQYPSSLNHVISVGASDSGSVLAGGSGDLDGRASFSQYGVNAVDVVAPGADLVGAGVGTVASGSPGSSNWVLASGTSFSAPLVAGLAALVESRNRDVGAGLTNDDIENIIQTNTIDLPDDPNDSPNGGANWDGNGLVDFRACIDAVPTGPTNNPPTAVAGPNQSGLVSDTFNFDGSGSSDPDGPIASYSWTFGDGNSASGANVSHSYASAGTYTVTLTVSDGSLTDSDTLTVTVSSNPVNNPPTAVAGANQSGLVTDTFSFDGSGSSDPDGPIASYSWTFGDGNSASGANVSHSYASAGTYTVTLTVSDGSLTDSDSLTVTVDDPPPTGGTLVYLVNNGGISVPGVGNLSSDDVYVYDVNSGTFSLYFDGSDVGITSGAMDAIAFLPDGDMLFSRSAAMSIPGLTGGPSGTSVDDSDIIRFTPSSTGANTAGVFTFYFDGSDVGLTSNGEDIDGLSLDGSGNLVVSSVGGFSGNGQSGADEDFHVFNATSLGASTSGTFSRLFDGSDVGMGGNGAEDICALHWGSSNEFYFSTIGTGAMNGGYSVVDEDVTLFTATSTGNATAGSFSLFLDLSAAGISTAEDTRGLHIAD